MVSILRFALAAALALAACCACAADGVLAPGPVVAMLRTQAGAPVFLRSPIAIAPTSGEVFVIDGASGALLRVDPFSGIAAQLLQRAFSPGARIAAGTDHSVYLLDPAARRIERFDRNGRPVSAFATDSAIGRLTDLALDERRGRLLAADGVYEQLVSFPPLGRQAMILPLRAAAREPPPAPVAIAVGARAIYASDASCACIFAIDFDGQVLASFGHGHLAQPGRLAVDAWERVFVIDRADRTLKLVAGPRLLAQWPAPVLGMVELGDVAIAADWLYIADPATGRIRMMRILPPPKQVDDAPRQ